MFALESACTDGKQKYKNGMLKIHIEHVLNIHNFPVKSRKISLVKKMYNQSKIILCSIS